jgi:hypothetical protein
MALSNEKIALMRRRYVDGVPVDQILAEFKVSRGTLYHWLDGGPQRGPRHLPPIPRRGKAGTCRGALPSGARELLIDRLWRTASRQVQEIENRLAARAHGEAGEPAERERDARMLAVLVKTLRELAALDEANKDAASAAQPEPEDDDPVPRDIDEFRRELARRIQAFVGSEDGAAVPGDDP